jgi:serine/threonine protein kinase
VHRDVKPSNILLECGIERTLLTDFGLVRAGDDASLTHTGCHPGTPQYMSPEQARGDGVDGRSDLFSLGSVMYAMCTGRPPFRAETSYGILRKITDSEPRPIREINPQIPEWLERTIANLLAKRVEDRFQSAEQLAELLRHCLAHVQQPTVVDLPLECRPVARNGSVRRRWLIAPAVVAAVILAAWLSGMFAQPGAHRGAQSSPPAATSYPDSGWDGTSTGFQLFEQDLSAAESRSQPLWDERP